MKNYDFAKTDPPAIKKFDAESAVYYMETLFSAETEEMKKIADSFVVNDLKSMNQAIEMINQAKKLWNAVDKERKIIKDPYLVFTKKLDGISNNIKDPLVEIQGILNEKVKPVALAIKRKDEEDRAKEAAARLKIEEANKGKAVKTVVPPKAASTHGDGLFKTAEGSAQLNTFFKWDVIDFKAVPKKYKKTIIDEAKLDADIQAGAKVAGVNSYEDVALKTRVNKR